MNSLVMWIAGLLAVVLAALFAVPMLIDWNSYRGVFEEEASRILGRDVRVGGAVNLRLLPSPYLSFEKLRVADLRAGSGNPLFRAESFTLWLSVPPLLQGNLEVRRIALAKPEAYLALDASGKGSWTSLGITPQSLPFMPSRVAFQSVEISDGTLVLEKANGAELVRLEQIGGTFSAEALDGPMHYSGDVTMNGATRAVRLATAQTDPDGAVRFKATIHSAAATGANTQIEGRIVDPMGQVRLEGNIAMSVPLPELPAAARQADADKASGGAPPPGATPANGPVSLDLRGALAADARRLTVGDIALSIENVGQPQLMTGSASLAYGADPKLDFELAARWLDLDRLAGKTGKASPAATLATLADVLVGTLPAKATTHGQIDIDLLTLGGEGVGSVDIAVARVPGKPVRIERLLASLPAGARIGLTGELSRAAAEKHASRGDDGVAAVTSAGTLDAHMSQGSDVTLDAQLTVAGPSLHRLAQWATPGLAALTPDVDGAFSLDSGLSYARERIALTDARATFGGSILRGALGVPLESGSTGAVDIAISADRFAWDWLSDGELTRRGVLDWIEKLSGSRADAEGGGARSTTLSAADTASRAVVNRDVKIRFSANTLTAGSGELRNVAAELELAGERLRIGRLAFQSDGALDVDLKGELTTRAGIRSGVIEGTAAATDQRGVARLLALASLTNTARASEVGDLAPLSIAGRIELGKRLPGATEIRLDGAAAAGRINVRAVLDGGFDGWRSAPVDVSIAADDVLAPKLMALLVAGRSGTPTVATRRDGTERALRANAAIKAVGTPSENMLSDIALTSEGLSLAYNGRTRLTAEGDVGFDGALEIAAERLGDVLAVAGLTGGARSLDSAVTGTVGLATAAAGGLKLSPAGLMIAGAKLDGALLVRRGEGGPVRLEGRLVADRASVAGLLGGLTAGAPQPMPVLALPSRRSPNLREPSLSAPSGAEAAAIWTDQPFVAEAFDRFDGAVTLEVRRLALAPDLNLANAVLAMQLAAGRIAVDMTDGSALGGKITGSMELTRAPAGIGLAAKIEARGVELAAIARMGGASRAAVGKADASIDFTGRALSPRALIAAIGGKGSVILKDAAVEGFSAAGVQAAVARVLDAGVGADAPPLAEALLENAGGKLTPLGSARVGIEVIDGALRVERFGLDAAEGRTEVLSTIDLVTFDQETEWRITANAREHGRASWPAVSIFYVGRLGDLAAMEPRVAHGALERELTVRRMEREVDKLEQLRRADEERAAAERQRQKELAEERARLAREREKAFEEAQKQQQLELELELELERGARSPLPQSGLPPGSTAAPPPGDGAALKGAGGQAGVSEASGGADQAGTLVPADAGQLNQATPSVTVDSVSEGAAPGVERLPSSRTGGASTRRARAPRRPSSAGDTTLRALSPIPY
ncbi:MAG: AsmA family protein [Hyphomicrobiaceae bacterium]|nr:AsmA family protein [Hyphomicrobiaceae bacterium]